MSRAVISLGGNLGDRRATIDAAIETLRGYVTVDAVSPYYESDPVGVDPMPDFLNAIVLVTTDLTPYDLIELGQSIERDAGRVPQPRGRARPLDVDVIVYDDVVSDDPQVTLPHPRAWQRTFVLRPWLDVDPDAVIPGHGRVADLIGDAIGEVRPG
jgi:2-amino-4-hydroxy-6-hydroxymethyldihydropteridine diphosphokinase